MVLIKSNYRDNSTRPQLVKKLTMIHGSFTIDGLVEYW